MLASVGEPCTASQLASGLEWTLTRTIDALQHLEVALANPGQTLTPDQLLKLAWNDPLGVGPDRVKFGIMRLRRKLGQDAGTGGAGASIEAVRGFGYRYVPPAARTG